MTSDLERRAATGVGAEGRRVRGYAIVFGEMSEDLGGFREIIEPSAVDRTFAEGIDVRALVDHDPGKVIGRKTAETLRLVKDQRGLLVEIDVPKTTAGDDILELARHEAQVEWSFFTFKVSEVIADAAASFRPVCAKQNIQLETSVVDAELPIFGNPDRLTQVLVNLIGNAVKFTPDGGSIRVSARRETTQPDDPHLPPARLRQKPRAQCRVIPPDRHQVRDPQAPQALQHLLHLLVVRHDDRRLAEVLLVQQRRPRRAQNRPPFRMPPRHVRDRQPPRMPLRI